MTLTDKNFAYLVQFMPHNIIVQILQSINWVCINQSRYICRL